MIMNQNDDTALMRAARTGDVPMVGLLLDRGASIDIVDRVRTYGLCCVNYIQEEID